MIPRAEAPARAHDRCEQITPALRQNARTACRRPGSPRALVARRVVAMAGTVAERPWFQGILQEPDPQQQLWLLARLGCRIKRRTARLNEVICRAASSDPEIGELW